MARPRVLLVSNRAEIVGGGEISLLLLAEGLAGRGEFEVVLATPGPGEVRERATALGLRCVELPLLPLRTRPWRLVTEVRRARAILNEVGAEIVHANGTRAMFTAGRAAAREGIAVVWHVRVEGPDRVDSYLSRRATRIITPSSVVGSRYPAAEVRVVANPVEIPTATEVRAEAAALREELTAAMTEAEGGHPVLLSVAQITPRKGIGRILEALPLIDLPARPLLLVAGKEDPEHPYLLEQLRGRVDSLGLEGRVRFLGFRDDVPQLLAACDLLVHAPEKEGFGRVFVEAMSVGLPVVCTPVGGLVELHEATGYGWLADDLSPQALARAISEALQDEAARTSMAETGPQQARELFSVKAHVDAVAGVYHEILGGGS